VARLGAGKVDYTIGSALDIFGGSLSYARVVEWDRENALNSTTSNSLTRRVARRSLTFATVVAYLSFGALIQIANR